MRRLARVDRDPGRQVALDALVRRHARAEQGEAAQLPGPRGRRQDRPPGPLRAAGGRPVRRLHGRGRRREDRPRPAARGVVQARRGEGPEDTGRGPGQPARRGHLPALRRRRGAGRQGRDAGDRRRLAGRALAAGPGLLHEDRREERHHPQGSRGPRREAARGRRHPGRAGRRRRQGGARARDLARREPLDPHRAARPEPRLQPPRPARPREGLARASRGRPTSTRSGAGGLTTFNATTPPALARHERAPREHAARDLARLPALARALGVGGAARPAEVAQRGGLLVPGPALHRREGHAASAGSTAST